MRKSSTLVLAIGALLTMSVVNAAPMTFTASGEIRTFNTDDPIDDGLLPDFLGETPQLNDAVSFSITFDPDTFGPALPSGLDPNTVLYLGGVTAASFRYKNVELQSGIGQGFTSTTVTTSSLVVPGTGGLTDGFLFAGGNNDAAQTKSWAIGLFFVGGDLADTSAPNAIPDLDDFDAAFLGFRSFDKPIGDPDRQTFDGFGVEILMVEEGVSQIPLPAAAWLFFAGLPAGLLGMRRLQR